MTKPLRAVPDEPAPPPEPPGHLSDAMKAWWRDVEDTYRLEPAHRLLMTHAAESWDRAEQARLLVDVDGPVQVDRFGQKKPHPAVAIERDARAAFARSLRQLDLEGEPDPLYRRR